MLNKSGLIVNPCGTPVSMIHHLIKKLSTFICCLRFDESHSAISKILDMVGPENAISQLVDYDLDSWKFLRDLLKEFQKLHYYWLEGSNSQSLAIDSVV